MLSIVYVSSATHLLEDGELVEMLRTCVKNNTRDQITGLLLYKGGNFMQAIEGPDDAVRALFERILQDPRHTAVYKLRETPIQQREFSKWSMAFRNVDRLPPEALAGFSLFLNDEFTADVFRQDPGRAHKLLLMFRENVR